MFRRVISICFFLLTIAGVSAAAAGERLTVGVLKFGTVNWQLDSLKRNGFDADAGVELDLLPLASKNATAVALQAGEVDLIVSDWIWALRQRAAGADFLFVPYSNALGALVTGPESGIASLEDLTGKRLGIAGGPIDKSWLVLQSWSRHQKGMDAAKAITPVFAAPPLLSEQLRQGRIDAVLTFWPYAARHEAEGFRRLFSVQDLLTDLGVTAPPGLVGYVFREALLKEKPKALQGFFQAIAATNALLAESAGAWRALRPLMKVSGDREFESLKAGYRAGIPERSGPPDLASAEKLFDILAAVGGERLVGTGTRFDPALFWDPGGP